MNRLITLMVVSFVLTMYGALAKLESWPYSGLFLVLGITSWFIVFLFIIKLIWKNQATKS